METLKKLSKSNCNSARINTVWEFIVSYVPSPNAREAQQCDLQHRFPGGYSSVVPPDPIPNSAVKRARADGSVA